jgi:hypothetical protein
MLGEFSGVPKRMHSISGIIVEQSEFGLGVYWRGHGFLPRGTWITVYPGKSIISTEAELDQLDLSYTVELHQATNTTLRSRKQSRYLNALGYGSEEGVGHLINSCSPRNKVYIEQVPNARLVETRTLNNMYGAVVQAIDDISPGEQLLIDYHDMLYSDFPCYQCCCYVCITIELSKTK